MSEDKNIKEQPEDYRPPPTDNIEKAAEASSFSSEQKKTVDEENIFDSTPSISSEENETVAEENIQHLTPNIQHNKEIMEVHHHGHVHEKKKWKEYLFQFLMLFLAVFCGFLAEYQLEQMIERHKEKDYIKSFTEDLQADEIYLDKRLTNINEKLNKADSLIFLLSKNQKKVAINDIYYLIRATIRHLPSGVNDRTIVQLRNAGGMRLISNRMVSDSIVSYYQTVDNLKSLDGRLIDLIQNFNPTLDKLLDGIDYGKLTDTTTNSILRVNEPMKLRTTDPEIINTSIMHVQRLINISIANKMAIRELQKKAQSIKEFIKKQYHLEDE